MKTIEERAEEWVDSPEAAAHPYNRRGMIDAYIAGSKAKYEELTRWHDPKEELPDGNRDVLIKTTLCTKYRIAFYKANETRNYHWHENNGAIDDDMVIGWREIQE